MNTIVRSFIPFVQANRNARLCEKPLIYVLCHSERSEES